MVSSRSDPTGAGSGGKGDRKSDRSAVAVLAKLTDRDLYLLQVLAEHAVLTADMAAALAFDSRRRARHRLLTLTSYGVLTRFRRCPPTGSLPWRYTLSHKGAVIVANLRGQTPPSTVKSRLRIEALAASARLEHDLGVNGFFTTLAEHGRRSDGLLDLRQWRSARQCAQACGNLVHPDGYGRWQDGRDEVCFYLEYDTGTEQPATRLADKLPGYAHLALALDEPVLVTFWFPEPRREAHARNALAGSVPAGVTVATSNARMWTPPEGWLTTGAHTRVRLGTLRHQTPHQTPGIKTPGT